MESYLSVLLQEKNLSKGYQVLKDLEKISQNSNELYPYMSTFIDMIQSEKYVIRVRGFRLFCKQAKWDIDNIINQNIEVVLKILNDEEPTAVRQALVSLENVVIYKPELKTTIKEQILNIDCSKYKDSMQSLIYKDRESLLEVMEKLK